MEVRKGEKTQGGDQKKPNSGGGDTASSVNHSIELNGFSKFGTIYRNQLMSQETKDSLVVLVDIMMVMAAEYAP